MLDDFGTEMDHAESRVDTTVKKIAKVLHLSNGKAIAGDRDAEGGTSRSIMS